MDMMTIGSVNSYMKTLRLQTKWNMKKAGGDVTGRTAKQEENARVVELYQQQSDERRKNGDDELERVLNKMYAGGKLTQEERKLVKEKAPEEYQKLEEAERRQQQFEQDLRRCKTKEDVQRLKMTYAGMSMDRVHFIEHKILHNKNVPEGKKLALIKLEALKQRQTEERVAKFIRDGEYAKLPTDREKEKVEREEREAREAARRPAKTGDPESKPEAERTEDETKSAAERRETKADAELKPESDEARKVRRAKARAYAPVWVEKDDSSETVNVKA